MLAAILAVAPASAIVARDDAVLVAVHAREHPLGDNEATQVVTGTGGKIIWHPRNLETMLILR